MKLLLVTYGLDTVGGVQSWQHLFTHQLLDRGHDVTILEMYDYSGLMPDKKFVRDWDKHITIIKLNGPIIQRGINRYTSISALKVVFNYWKKLKLHRFITRNAFDALLFPDPNFTFSFLSRTITQNNSIVQFHSSFDRFKKTSHLRYWLTKRKVHSFKKFLLLSKGDVDKAIENGFPVEKLSHIYNFINESKFQVFQENRKMKMKQILVVGNLDNPDKQIDHVLKAFASINKQTTQDWTIKIVGEGATRIALQELCYELSIDKNVKFVGKKINPAQEFSESAFYVLSSSFEGFPLTLLECIFTNLPIVSYECAPSIKEIVQERVNGLVVEKNSVENLAKAMEHLMNDPNLLERMAENQNFFKEKFSSKKIIEQWEEILFGAQEIER
jgi:glycosyltransferase involved in cell wall biosynthesis